MTDIGVYVSQAKLSCESCEFEADSTGAAMVHAMHTTHTLSGETPEGHEVSISIEQEE
jgi:hypothetical protein